MSSEGEDESTPLLSSSNNRTSPSLIVKGITLGLAQVIAVALVLLVPAAIFNNLFWPRAYIFLGIYAVMAASCQLALAVLAPESFMNHMKPPISEKQDPRDRWITLMIVFSEFATYLSVPILIFGDKDNPMETIPLPVTIIGLVLNCAGYLIIMLASYQNSFCVTIVHGHVQQVVVDTGMYAYVRHPMYSGLYLYLIGVPLWFDSAWSLGFVIIFSYAIHHRMEVEEDVLTEHLLGYREYKASVPYRLVPFCM